MNSLKSVFYSFIVFFVGVIGSAFAATDKSSEHDSFLERYVAITSAEIKCLESKVAIEQWKLARWQGLEAKGFASWLEVRRQKTSLQTRQKQLQSLAAFEAFLLEVVNQAQLHPNFESRSQSFSIRVSLPGSLRTIGWIDGFPVDHDTLPIQLESAKFETLKSKEAEADARRKLESVADDSSHRELLALKWNATMAQKQLAIAKLRYIEAAQSRQSLTQPSHEHPHWTSIEANSLTIRPEDDPDLELATLEVARAEAEAHGAIDSAQHQLQLLATRHGVLTRLHADGNAPTQELKHVEQQLSEYKEQHKRLTAQNQLMKEAFARISVNQTNLTPRNDSVPKFKSVSDWPKQVFQSEDAMHYLIQRRRSYFEREAKLQYFAIQVQMLSELVERLKLAVESNPNNVEVQDRFSQLLSTGQEKEIASYVSKIAQHELFQQVISEEKTILVLEENRYLEQLRSPSPHAMELALATTGTFALGTVVSSGNAANTSEQAISYRYLESDGWARTTNLVFASTSILPLHPFAGTLGSVQPRSLINHRRSLSFAPSRPVFQGHASSLSSRDRRKSFPEIEFAAPSLYNSPYATHHYRKNQLKAPSVSLRNAYPFGILRSDLRRFTNASQPPWLLPGSPNNLRASQLHSGYRSTQRGSPKSRNDVAPGRLGW